MIRMIIVIIGCIAGLTCSLTVSAQNIHFKYDESGNREKRHMVSARVEDESGEETTETAKEILEEDKLYPNPTEGILRFSLLREDPAVSQVSLIDLNGRLLYRKTFTEQDFEVNISNRPAGIYVLKWTFADQSRSIKIIKQ